MRVVCDFYALHCTSHCPRHHTYVIVIAVYVVPCLTLLSLSLSRSLCPLSSLLVCLWVLLRLPVPSSFLRQTTPLSTRPCSTQLCLRLPSAKPAFSWSHAESPAKPTRTHPPAISTLTYFHFCLCFSSACVCVVRLVVMCSMRSLRVRSRWQQSSRVAIQWYAMDPPKAPFCFVLFFCS